MRIMHVSTKKDHSCFEALTLQQAKTQEVIFVVIAPSEDASYTITTNYVERGIRYIHLNAKKDADFYPDPELERSFYGLIKKYCPDILHIQQFSGVNAVSILRSALAFRINKKFITLHDHSLFCVKGICYEGRVCRLNSLADCNCGICRMFTSGRGISLETYNEERWKRGKEILSLADGVICCSLWQKKTLERLFDQKEKLRVLYYGVGLPFPRPRKRNSFLPITFGYLGSTHYLKGLQILENACGYLPKGRLKIIMALLTNSKDSSNMEYMGKLKDKVSIKVIRNIKEAQLYERFFSRIDYLIIPSVWEETGPMTLFESFYCRVPVIISNQPSMVEKIKGNNSSLVFGNAKELGELLEALIDGIIPRRSRDIFPVKTAKEYAKEVAGIYKESSDLNHKELTLKIGYLCNNNCIFCVTGHNQPKDLVPFNILKDRLRKYRDEYAEVLFTGGEPTIHRNIIQILNEAHRLGYKITLETNARMINDSNLLEKIKMVNPAVITHLESHNPVIHDAISRAQGSFYQTVSAVMKLRKTCEKLFIKVMITKLNYRDVLLTVKFISKLKVDRIWFVFPDPSGYAYRYFSTIIPTYTTLRPYLNNALSWLMANTRIEIRLENFPYCCVDDESRSSIWFQTTVNDREMFGCLPGRKKDDTYYPIIERLLRKKKMASCSSCKYSQVCEGVYGKYIQTYGENEFISIP